MSVETIQQQPADQLHNEQDNNIPGHRTKRQSLKRVASKIFGRHKSKDNTDSSTPNPPEPTPTSNSSSSSRSSSSRSRSSSSSSSASSSSTRTTSHSHEHSPHGSSSRRNASRHTAPNLTRRASIQGRKNLMSAALPAEGPERRRAARALLAELEKYDQLQRRSRLRDLPPLQFHVTVEKRVNGRTEEVEIEVSMNELREQLQEILRTEPQSPVPRPPAVGGLRQIKSATNVGVKDVSIFPTHIYDGRPLPSEKTACTICIDDYVEGDEIKSLPCLHFYHSECIDEWFKRSTCCPNCNADVNS